LLLGRINKSLDENFRRSNQVKKPARLCFGILTLDGLSKLHTNVMATPSRFDVRQILASDFTTLLDSNKKGKNRYWKVSESETTPGVATSFLSTEGFIQAAAAGIRGSLPTNSGTIHFQV
jgi:hypothetical protein